MAWQAYVDTSLLGSGLVDHVAIFDRQSHEVLASSPGYLVSYDEYKVIRDLFSDEGTGPFVQNAREKGFKIAGRTYLATKADKRSLYGAEGKDGVMIVNTLSSTFIIHYPSSSSHLEVANLIEQLCDYLISTGC